MKNRRSFLMNSAAGAGALFLGAQQASMAQTPSAAKAAHPSATGSRKLKLLILGGTGFIGPWQVRYALEQGHEVTIFNRGRSGPGQFEGVEELVGDRAKGELDALKGRRWDAVIDNSASRSDAPAWVRDSANLLKDSVDQYLFISTRSVYRDLSQVPATVDMPLLTKETTPNWSEGKRYPYGLAKALAEAEAVAAFGGRATIVRPGLIVGPGDPTDRFTYWPVRIERGGEVLAPGDPMEDRVQVIDVRDLCEWAVRLCDSGTTGTFMGIGPENGRSIAEVLYGVAASTSAPVKWTWVPASFLAEHKLRPYREMPVWKPSTPADAGFARFDLSREVAAGLTFRTLSDTTEATLAFHHGRPEEKQKLRSGISAEREAAVLAAWHESQK